ncbi:MULTISPECIES: hexose kinase [Arthrobacter]|uniref:Hexose kinase n=2 Tax=Arthrobacter TaxID=1663 RepID=A0ABU9KPT8_9MICC|nr:hexose kinase [Arthrobacter sp. YJM1]MDP5228295.1 hexose kinase [Arthrobacter sp. YJM1]
MSAAAHDGSRIVTVTPNPALDTSYTVPRIEHGASHRVAPPLIRAGGKGLNVARVVHQQGRRALAIAPVGGNTGEAFRAELESSGVPSRLVPVQAETRRSMAFVEETLGDTTIFNEAGHALQPGDWQRLAAAVVDGLQDAAVLVGSGSLPPGAPADFYPALVTLAHQHGVPAVIDTSGPGILAAARAGADVLKPNHVELREAFGGLELDDAVRELLRLGARTVVVSSGSAGMRLFSADHPRHSWAARLAEPLHGNPTGAGDAAVAALATALAEGVDEPEDVLRRAASWSAAAVLMPGAGEISERHTELEQMLIVTLEETA